MYSNVVIRDYESGHLEQRQQDVAKFRVGQRVMVVEDQMEDPIAQGEVGTITNIDLRMWQPDPWSIEVLIDPWRTGDDDRYWFHESELQVISLATT